MFKTIFWYKIVFWICECVLWIHKGFIVVEKKVSNGGIIALWYIKVIELYLYKVLYRSTISNTATYYTKFRHIDIKTNPNSGVSRGLDRIHFFWLARIGAGQSPDPQLRYHWDTNHFLHFTAHHLSINWYPKKLNHPVFKSYAAYYAT